jgi:hypothetical protein
LTNVAGGIRGTVESPAVFADAKLGGAIWTDGRTCAADSVGTCR